MGSSIERKYSFRLYEKKVLRSVVLPEREEVIRGSKKIARCIFLTKYIKVYFIVEQTMEAQRERYSCTLSLTSMLDGVWSQGHVPSLYPRERDPVPIVQGAGWTPGSVWTVAEMFARTGIRSPDRPSLASRYTDCTILHHQILLEWSTWDKSDRWVLWGLQRRQDVCTGKR